MVFYSYSFRHIPGWSLLPRKFMPYKRTKRSYASRRPMMFAPGRLIARPPYARRRRVYRKRSYRRRF